MEAFINSMALIRPTSIEHRGVYMPTLVEASINSIRALDGQGSYGSFRCSRISTSIKKSLAIHLESKHMARKHFFREILRRGVEYS
jgi:hypothetical protein